MTLEEVKKLSNDELDCTLHFAAFPDIAARVLESERFNRWQSAVSEGIVTGYCASLDRVAEIEKIVVEKRSAAVYGDALETAAEVWNPKYSDTPLNPKLRGNWVYLLATASARVRAEALLMCLEGKNEQTA